MFGNNDDLNIASKIPLTKTDLMSFYFYFLEEILNQLSIVAKNKILLRNKSWVLY